MVLLIFFLLYFVLFSLTCYLLFPKLDIDPVKGLIPVVNVMEISNKVGRSKWYGALSIVPIVGIFITTGLAVALVRSFGKYSFGEAAKAVVFAPLSFYQLAKDDRARYKEPILTAERAYLDKIKAAKKAGHEKKLASLIKKNPYKKSIGREWFESIFFAVFAAAFIRMFLIEAYVIPTPSMEGSMLVGDFLFVSKSSYGIRTPQTIAMVPLLHNRVPKLGTESYLKRPKLPYYRFPAIREIKNGSPIVFNWPVGDSVYITKKRSYTLGQVRRQPEFMQSDPELVQKIQKEDFVVRPMDKKDHYIKRAIGIPGDSVRITDGQVYVNGVASENPEHLQFMYLLQGNAQGINQRKLNEWGIEAGDAWGRPGQGGYFLDQRQVEQLQSAGSDLNLIRIPNDPSPKRLFPHDPEHFPDWSVDDYGPIYIPQKGATTPINKSTIALYKKLITDYEHNTLEERDGQFFINGELTEEYTFKQDYYWAMGDNRHNSEDSRMWGFVPHDHLVGRPLLIWFSTKGGSIFNGLRRDRLFKPAGNI
ncbi:MAG: signal peptidase I [Bacteroidota bacterium]